MCRSKHWVAMAVAVGALSACAHREPVPVPAAGPLQPRLVSPRGTLPLNQARQVDARIMGVLEQACSKLIAEAAVGKREAVSPEVRGVAASISDSCATFLDDQRALAPTLGIAMGSPAVQSRFGATASDAVAELFSQDATEFDRVFLEKIIADEDDVLGLVDGTLLPAANYTELQSVIEVQLRRPLEQSLKSARELQLALREGERRSTP